MGIENFIKDALYKPNDYTAYHVGRKLAELHPDAERRAYIDKWNCELQLAEVLLGQTELLRGQMSTKKKKASGSSRR